MWILHFIPEEWIRLAIHAVVAIGLVMYLASTMVKMLASRLAPGISASASAIRIAGAAIFVAGIYFEGGYGVEMEWRRRVDEMQQRVEQARIASDRANQALEQAQRDRAQALAQSTALIQARIRDQRATINNACKVEPLAVEIYNQSINGIRSPTR